MERIKDFSQVSQVSQAISLNYTHDEISGTNLVNLTNLTIPFEIKKIISQVLFQKTPKCSVYVVYKTQKTLKNIKIQ